MGLEISRREVLNNLIRFKDSLLDRRDERSEQLPRGRRSYKVLLNCKTGDMRFAKKISSLEHHISRSRKVGRGETPGDWKEIQIIVSQETPAEVAHFEVLDAKNRSLNPADIEPLAWKIASETLDILNQKAEQVKGENKDLLPEEVVLKDLSSIHISVSKDRIEDLPGWMESLSRIEAEQMLQGKPVGTYLLREGDELTVSISFHVAEENLLQIRPYLLTVVEQEGKVSDILLLQTGKGWTLYQDDPNLKDPVLYKYFSSPQGLLRQISGIARFPLN